MTTQGILSLYSFLNWLMFEPYWHFEVEATKVFVICIGNRMDASAIKDLHHERYSKILSKLHGTLYKRVQFEEFSNTTSSANPELLEL